jgi:hypothetical protein
MEMEANQVLNQIDFNFFMKMIETKDFKTPKNQAQNQIRGSIQFYFLKNTQTKMEIENQTTLVWATNQICHYGS